MESNYLGVKSSVWPLPGQYRTRGFHFSTRANTEEPKDFTSQQGQILKNPRISLLNKGNTEEPEDFTSQQGQILKNPRISLLDKNNY
jgi:hypothetical protein